MKKLMDLYLLWGESKGNTHRTHEWNEHKIKAFIEFLNNDPHRITPDNVRQFLSELPVGMQTKKGYWRAIKAFIAWASDAERAYIQPLPRFRIKWPQARPKRAPDQAELLKRLDSLPRTTIAERRNYAMLHFIYYTGCRLSEAAPVRIEHLDFKRKIIDLYQQKTDKWIQVPMVDPLISILLSWMGHSCGGWIFPKYDKQEAAKAKPVCLRCVQDAWHDHQAGLSPLYTVHDLRRAFATHAHEGGLDPFELKELLGHSDIKTTLIYTNATSNSRLCEKMNKAFSLSNSH